MDAAPLLNRVHASWLMELGPACPEASPAAAATPGPTSGPGTTPGSTRRGKGEGGKGSPHSDPAPGTGSDPVVPPEVAQGLPLRTPGRVNDLRQHRLETQILSASAVDAYRPELSTRPPPLVTLGARREELALDLAHLLGVAEEVVGEVAGAPELGGGGGGSWGGGSVARLPLLSPGSAGSSGVGTPGLRRGGVHVVQGGGGAGLGSPTWFSPLTRTLAATHPHSPVSVRRGGVPPPPLTVDDSQQDVGECGGWGSWWK